MSWAFLRVLSISPLAAPSWEEGAFRYPSVMDGNWLRPAWLVPGTKPQATERKLAVQVAAPRGTRAQDPYIRPLFTAPETPDEARSRRRRCRAAQGRGLEAGAREGAEPRCGSPSDAPVTSVAAGGISRPLPSARRHPVAKWVRPRGQKGAGSGVTHSAPRGSRTRSGHPALDAERTSTWRRGVPALRRGTARQPAPRPGPAPSGLSGPGGTGALLTASPRAPCRGSRTRSQTLCRPRRAG